MIGTNDNTYYGRIEQVGPGRQHLILKGLDDTNSAEAANESGGDCGSGLACPGQVSRAADLALVLRESGASYMAFPGGRSQSAFCTEDEVAGFQSAAVEDNELPASEAA